MKLYVVGVAFDSSKKVVLIKKNHPKWMEGNFNLPGGEVNPNESPLDAMAREWAEEVGHGAPTHMAWKFLASFGNTEKIHHRGFDDSTNDGKEDQFWEVLVYHSETVSVPLPYSLLRTPANSVGRKSSEEYITTMDPQQLIHNEAVLSPVPWLTVLALDRDPRKQEVHGYYGNNPSV